jgi:hypothetical protein
MCYLAKKFTVPSLVVALLVAASLACGSETVSPTEAGQATSTSPPATAEEAQAQPTPAPQATNTPRPAPTNTPEPTKPVYVEPTVLLELEGTGATVTDNFELPSCQKAIFYWTAAASQSNTASLIVDLHTVGEEREGPLVNEFEMDVPAEGIGGATLQPLAGGEYYFTTENTDLPWTLRAECQDGQAPAGSEIDLQGAGNTVTANYELPACQKSVFIWSVGPGSGGAASLIVHLCKVGADRCVSLVNEFKMDLTGPLEGEVLQDLTGGLYYLTTENLSGPWNIRWECRD